MNNQNKTLNSYRNLEKIRFLVDMFHQKPELTFCDWYYYYIKKYGQIELGDFILLISSCIPESLLENINYSTIEYEIKDSIWADMRIPTTFEKEFERLDNLKYRRTNN